jgi:c-di-GMP-binding flagellar brake protein YcgR
MFERTVSLWRRLVGPRSQRSATSSTAEDRRVWVRHPVELETTYRAASDADPTRFAAVVRDISGGGLSLLADREFTPGELLSVELPGPTEENSYSALACVVHVAPQAEGQWLVGCTFARELSDEDLAAFGARRSRPQPSDQRSWERYACNVQAIYQLATDPFAGPCQAQVLNISASGVGLLVDHAIENGTLLSVNLRPTAGGAGKMMLACVVHVGRDGEGQWALGCNFITELTESDLLALL